jgi:hypothetical protein
VSALRFVHWGIRKFPLNDPLDECPFHVVVVTIDGSLLKSIVSGSREVFFRARGLGRSGVFGRITLRNSTVALH